MEEIQGLKPGAYLRHNTYRIEKVLGQGGFGITYLAMDLNLDRYVAIKEFFPKDYCDRDDSTSHVTLGTQSSKEFVNRLKAKFLKEARNIAKFDHPGIIRIHSAFEENNTAYYVMDYIEGQTLSEIVKLSGPIPESKALHYIDKVGSALEYVHEHNMTHLDVKPANIIIRSIDQEPILIDFGLAKQYDAKGNQTSTTPIGISHGYAPMEQYNDGGVKEFSPQTDLYSLSATLYYILSGVVPPQATKLIEDELTFPQIIRPQLIQPISKGMAPRRKNRYETVVRFLDDLNTAAAENEVNKDSSAVYSSSKASSKQEQSGNRQEEEDTVLTESGKGPKRFLIMGGLMVVIVLAITAVVLMLLPDSNKDNALDIKMAECDSILKKEIIFLERPDNQPSFVNIQELEKVKRIYGEVESQASKEFLNSSQMPNRINLINRLINEIDQYEQSKELGEKAKLTEMTEEYVEFSKAAEKHRTKINQLIEYLK